MKAAILTGAIAAGALALAAPAFATVSLSFDGGLPSPSLGYNIVDTFDNADNIVGTAGIGFDYVLTTQCCGPEGAVPANSSPMSGQYLAVLGSGSIDYNFLSPISKFQFDWGSVDGYNTIIVHQVGGDTIFTGASVPGASPLFGDRANDLTNGLATFRATSGGKITGFTMSSGQNSFEIDNVAVGVPEPATWAMMILGFGAAGSLIRRRRAMGLTA